MSQEVELKPMETNKTQDTEQDTAQAPTGLDENASVQGAENPAFSETDEESEGSEVTPMTFVDFLPRILEEAGSSADAPLYTDFK